MLDFMLINHVTYCRFLIFNLHFSVCKPAYLTNDQFACIWLTKSTQQHHYFLVDVLYSRLWLACHQHEAFTGHTPVMCGWLLSRSQHQDWTDIRKALGDLKYLALLETNEVPFSYRSPLWQTWTLHWSVLYYWKKKLSRWSGKSAVMIIRCSHWHTERQLPVSDFSTAATPAKPWI